MIPYSRQNINQSDINSVTTILKSNFLTQGPTVKNFEEKIKKLVKSKFAVSANSATSALHLACLALGIKKNDVVWTVPNTFAASANCAINCGARIDFVDIDELTFNISINELEKKLIRTPKKKLPKLLIPVHLGGQPSEQKKIWSLSRKYKFKILEDASHSIGAKHFGEPVGSCKWSDITVFSFHPVKIITTGEGGMATTNNLKYAQKMELFRTNGIVKDKAKFLFRKKIKQPWYYEQQSLGFNYWMSDIQAALGISQLKRLKTFIKKRNNVAKFYKRELKNLPLKMQIISKKFVSSYHLFIISINLKKFKYTYDQIFKKLIKKGLNINLHYLPIHLHPYYKNLGFKKGQFPVAENYSDTSISIPIFYDLTKKEMIKVVKIIKQVLKI